MSSLGLVARALKSAHRSLRETTFRRWNRDLPFADLLLDRWERARRLGFGHGASIYDSSCVFGNVTVGDHTWIGPNTILDGSGGLTIGSYCSISTGVQIYSHDSVTWALSGGRADYEHAPVSIGDCCYIGPQAVIAKGVRIGEHSVVGTHSFVNGDIEPYTIAVGAPCHPIGHVVVHSDGSVDLQYDREPAGSADPSVVPHSIAVRRGGLNPADFHTVRE